MITVSNLSKAKQLLDRKNISEPFVTSPGLAAQIKQVFGEDFSPQEVVSHIIDEVKDRGDKALFDYTRKLDGIELESLEVNRQEISAAYNLVDTDLLSCLKLAAKRIRAFHLACGHKVGTISIDKHLGRQIRPLDRIGIYVPGGTAAYPSTVLMTAIPAKVAGVSKIIMASPPGRRGRIPAATLVAADIAGVNRIFKVGGAQAIAALAFGTESIPKVDKICGPGNIFVTLAKKMVYGVADIDGLQGPSEVMIVADEKANPSLCAADLLAQAEHDPLASVILITTSAQLATRVDKEIELQSGGLQRQSIIRQATERGMTILVNSIEEAIELVNLYAPEHLELMVSDAFSMVSKVHHAGCIFVGENSPVVLGDYVAGPSHVLPTGGSAHFSSPLGVEDFLKVTHTIALDKATMQELGQAANVMAKAEGLDAHAKSIEKRLR